MNPSSSDVYTIPAKYRGMENAHIIFWLIKDISWCLIWKPLGIAMAIPTLIIAIIITHRTRKNISELAHNLAVSFWITANAYWMISEFFGFDEAIIFLGITGKQMALFPFGAGLLILAWYYLVQRPRLKAVAV